MNASEIERLVTDLMSEHGLIQQGWTFGWNRQASTFGLCIYSKKQIQFSSVRMLAETLEGARSTALHEIAHALTPGAGHGPEWVAKAEELGLRNPKPSRRPTGPLETEDLYKWGVYYGDRLIKGFLRRPTDKWIAQLPNKLVVGKPESKGQLRLVRIR